LLASKKEPDKINDGLVFKATAVKLGDVFKVTPVKDGLVFKVT
jgi:hypothetical protein